MKKYTTENNHNFTNQIMNSLNITAVDCLTMDENRDFTAVIDLLEIDAKETNNVFSLLTQTELEHKYILAKHLMIDYYIVYYWKMQFYISVIEKDATYNLIEKHLHTYNEIDFVTWWAKIKRTKQTHALNNGASIRVQNSIFHKVLEKRGLRVGGNIDGVMFEADRIVAIIDFITVKFVALDNIKANPADFFFKKGPRYETWYSTVKLSTLCNVPHFLMTIDGKDQLENHVGLTIIESLDKKGIYYKNKINPSTNIISGLNNIKEEITTLIYTENHSILSSD